MTMLCCVLVVLSLVGITKSGPACPEPSGDNIVWSTHTEPVTVEWDITEGSCNSVETCFGLVGTAHELMDIQLTPLSIQQGTELRFIGVNNTEPVFIQPYSVRRQDFHLCRINSGTALVEKPTIRYIDIPADRLKTGNNYFIANTDEDFSCENGFRVNVTVKGHDCLYPGSVLICEGHGHCVTDFHQALYKCQCCHGYEGQFCEVVDNCTGVECQNGGTCMNDPSGFHCHCKEGFTGRLCEYKADLTCTGDLCKNGGSCSQLDNAVKCECPPGYSGYYCEIDKNECASNPCHHGICVDKPNGFQCYCIPGYGGQLCSYEYDECVSSPCLNEGTCVDLLNAYSCKCGPGHTGINCQHKIDLCKSNTCVKNSTCIDQGDNYICECPPGYEGLSCEREINECNSAPCQNSGLCEDKVNGFMCHCTSGFTGIVCEDEAHINSHDAQQTTETKPDDSAHSSHSHHYFRNHIRNLYIILGTLGGAIFIVICTLVGCYCHVHKTYEMFNWNRLKYKQCDTDRQQFAFDISSACESRQSIDNACCEALCSDYEPVPGPSHDSPISASNTADCLSKSKRI